MIAINKASDIGVLFYRFVSQYFQQLYHFGDVVHFICNFGFVMSGSSSLVCTSTGAWNGTVPQCHCKLYFVTDRKRNRKITNMVASFFSFDVLDAKCVSFPDDKGEGLSVLRANTTTVLVPFKENVTIQCNNMGRKLRSTATSGFRQCVYDPKPVRVDIN